MPSVSEEFDLSTIEHDNIKTLNGHTIVVIEADYLSKLEGNQEQYVSAGLRRGAEEGEVYVYITKAKYEELEKLGKIGKDKLIEIVMHEQAEVTFLRNEADNRGLFLGADSLQDYSMGRA